MSERKIRWLVESPKVENLIRRLYDSHPAEDGEEFWEGLCAYARACIEEMRKEIERLEKAMIIPPRGRGRPITLDDDDERQIRKEYEKKLANGAKKMAARKEIADDYKVSESAIIKLTKNT